MKIAIFPGTFDPPSMGHLDIIKRTAYLVDHLYVAIGENSTKEVFFALEERLDFLKKITHSIPNVEVTHFSGLLIDFAKKVQANAIIKAIRNGSDFDYENIQASMNAKMAKVETIFMVPNDQFRQINSTFIRQIGQSGHRLHGFVPPEIEEQVFKRLTG